MPKRKETAKERREKSNKERLIKIAKKIEDKRTKRIIADSEVTTEELIEHATLVEENDEFEYDKFNVVLNDAKTILQKELEDLKKPVIQDIPEFLLNPDMEEERKAIMEKIELLLKYRYSLVFIADILQCNDYDKLDEIIDSKEKIYRLVESTSRESEEIDTIKIFSEFKKNVGNENSRIYSKQEDRMRIAIKSISEGIYFTMDDSPELALQDIISEIIDHPEFNKACRIETEFMIYEYDRLIKIFSELKSRSELDLLIEELRNISKTVKERSHAYSLMDDLINGIKDNTVEVDDDQRI